MPTSTARPAKMTKKDMERFRRLLNEKKASLSADLAKTRNAEEETSEEATQDIADKAVSSYTREFLYSRAASIYGGTAEIQRGIIAQRVLGLPRA